MLLDHVYASGQSYRADSVSLSLNRGDRGAAEQAYFNFAYQPSCAFDPKWCCPLAPPENQLDIAIRAGERLG